MDELPESRVKSRHRSERHGRSSVGKNVEVRRFGKKRFLSPEDSDDFDEEVGVPKPIFENITEKEAVIREARVWANLVMPKLVKINNSFSEAILELLSDEDFAVVVGLKIDTDNFLEDIIQIFETNPDSILGSMSGTQIEESLKQLQQEYKVWEANIEELSFTDTVTESVAVPDYSANEVIKAEELFRPSELSVEDKNLEASIDYDILSQKYTTILNSAKAAETSQAPAAPAAAADAPVAPDISDQVPTSPDNISPEAKAAKEEVSEIIERAKIEYDQFNDVLNNANDSKVMGLTGASKKVQALFLKLENATELFSKGLSDEGSEKIADIYLLYSDFSGHVEEFKKFTAEKFKDSKFNAALNQDGEIKDNAEEAKPEIKSKGITNEELARQYRAGAEFIDDSGKRIHITDAINNARTSIFLAGHRTGDGVSEIADRNLKRIQDRINNLFRERKEAVEEAQQQKKRNSTLNNIRAQFEREIDTEYDELAEIVAYYLENPAEAPNETPGQKLESNLSAELVSELGSAGVKLQSLISNILTLYEAVGPDDKGYLQFLELIKIIQSSLSKDLDINDKLILAHQYVVAFEKLKTKLNSPDQPTPEQYVWDNSADADIKNYRKIVGRVGTKSFDSEDSDLELQLDAIKNYLAEINLLEKSGLTEEKLNEEKLQILAEMAKVISDDELDAITNKAVVFNIKEEDKVEIQESVTTGPVQLEGSGPRAELGRETLAAKQLMRAAQYNYSVALKKHYQNLKISGKVSAGFAEWRGVESNLPIDLVSLRDQSDSLANDYHAKFSKQTTERSTARAGTDKATKYTTDSDFIKEAVRDRLITQNEEMQAAAIAEGKALNEAKFKEDWPNLQATGERITKLIPKSKLARLSLGLFAAAGLGAAAGSALGLGAAALGAGAGILRFGASVGVGMGAGAWMNKRGGKQVSIVETSLNELLQKNEFDTIAKQRQAIRLNKVQLESVKLRRKIKTVVTAVGAAFATRGIIGVVDALIDVPNYAAARPPATGFESFPIRPNDTFAGGSGVDRLVDDTEFNLPNPVLEESAVDATVEPVAVDEVSATTAESVSVKYTVQPGDTVSDLAFDNNKDLFEGLNRQQRNLVLNELRANINTNPDLQSAIGIKSGQADLIRVGEDLNFTEIKAELQRILAENPTGNNSEPITRAGTGPVPVMDANDPLGEFIKLEVNTEAAASLTEAELTATNASALAEYNPAKGGPVVYSPTGNYLNVPEYKAYIYGHMDGPGEVQFEINRALERVEGPRIPAVGFIDFNEPRVYEYIENLTVKELNVMAKTPNGIENHAAKFGANENMLREWFFNFSELKRSGLPYTETTKFSDLFSRGVVESYISNKVKK